MAKRGHDGDAAPHGMGEPMLELPLGTVGVGGLAPTLLVMQNLPSICSFAFSLSQFILATDNVDELVQWMYKSMCENHRSELPADRIEGILKDHANLLEMYLKTLGMDDGCSHDA